ncbi:2334_t:CDS:2 [Cetraspora pellucida]|uniref:2334_t:CDS:1 n=1 Tax=Cetraspora pellucida TaxID=1433469 RepID=A0A9N9NJ19_9GLOM|nr:2334_t:CDS:2 [Cetraspora pellucida]
MPPKTRKHRSGLRQDEVASALDTLRSGPSTAKKQKTTNESITQPLKHMNNNVENADVDGIDNDI